MEELKACPHCGGEAKITDHGGFYTVSCTNLDCAATIGLLEPTAEFAAADWNRRTAPENKPLTCEGCVNLRGGLGYLACDGCCRKFPDRYEARRPEDATERSENP